jgi:dipeptidyl aminopeptidase/acylaminoacyl peptidase
MPQMPGELKGTKTNITAHEGDVNNSPAVFSPDSTLLFFISDLGGEFRSLRSHHLATGEQKVVVAPKWDVWGADLSKSGKYLTVWINEDAAGTSRLYDAATLEEIRRPGMPTGVVRGLQVSRDDTKVAFYASDGSAPDDLYAGPLDRRPVRLTNALNPAIQRDHLVVPKRVRFKSYDGVEIPGLLYTPHQTTATAKAPALVMVHGGPGGQAQFGYSALTQALVNHGYVVFDINNRGSTGYGKTFYAMDDRKHGEADLGDVVASKQMLAATGYVDSSRTGIIGGSYGGYMVLAALTLQPARLQGRRGHVRYLELGTHSRERPALVGVVQGSTLRGNGQPKNGRRTPPAHLAPLQRSEDPGATHGSSGCQRPARSQNRV